MNRGTSQGIGIQKRGPVLRAAHGMDRVHRAGQHGTVRRTRPAAATPRIWALAASPID